MDEESYYHFSIPAMELEGNTEDFGGDDQDESLSQSISLPSLPVSFQEQLVHPEIGSSSTKNQVMSMKDLDDKLNALRRENFDLKVRLFCSSQNKGIPRFGEKYFVSNSTQTDGNGYGGGGYLKPPNPIRLSHGLQTFPKSMHETAIQTDPMVKVKYADKNTETDRKIVSSISIQTEVPTLNESVSSIDEMNTHSDQHLDHFKSIQVRLKEQLNSKSASRQSKALSTMSTISQANHDSGSINSPSLIPQLKSQSVVCNGNKSENEFDLSLIYNQTSSMLYNPDKSLSKRKPQSVKDAGTSECELLADEIDSKIQMLSKLSILGHHGKSRNRCRELNHQLNTNKSIDCDGSSSTLKSTTESFNGNQVKQLDNHRSTSKIFDIINRQVGTGPTVNIEKKREPMARINCREEGVVDVNYNLIASKPTSKRLSRMFEDSENHQFASPDLGIGDSDQDLNSDLKAFIPLGYYQLLRCNLHQLSSHLNYLDNLYRDCFVLQSISLSEYSTEMKPSLTHLNQTINSSRNICKNFSIEDENAISLRLDKIKAKKESMEKAITRQLRKTDKLLRKAKANLRAN